MTTTATKKRIFIVDDHPIMREGLAELIDREPDLEVCGEAGDAFSGLEAIGASQPDLLVADLSIPGKNGLEFIKDVQSMHPEIPVLVLSTHDESIYAERALRAGARGYVMKQEGGKSLMQAIRQVLSGQVSVSPKMSSKILDLFSGRRPDDSPIERLSDREFEVFQLIGQGKSVGDIADRLHLSSKTVEAHRAHIKEKLRIATSAELISFAARWIAAHGSI